MPKLTFRLEEWDGLTNAPTGRIALKDADWPVVPCGRNDEILVGGKLCGADRIVHEVDTEDGRILIYCVHVGRFDEELMQKRGWEISGTTEGYENHVLFQRMMNIPAEGILQKSR